MNEYKIEQKIKTLSKLACGLYSHPNSKPKVKIDGFGFKHWNFNKTDGWSGHAWTAKKIIKAENSKEAIDNFRQDLDEIIQKIGFISQCYMDFYKEPFLIYKMNDNNNDVFFYRHIFNRNPVGLQFGTEEYESYKKLEEFKHQEVFKFLKECREVTNYISRLTLLFPALESMCKKENESSYNRNKMIKILGGNFYNELFGDNGVRHKMLHGRIPEEAFGQNLVKKIYKKIIQYFNKELGTDISEDIVRPMRHFESNYILSDSFFKPSSKFKIKLQNCFDNCGKLGIDCCREVRNINLSNY